MDSRREMLNFLPGFQLKWPEIQTAATIEYDFKG
jgi:hypothetical protein